MGCHGTEKTNLIDGSLAYQNYQTFQEFEGEVNMTFPEPTGCPGRTFCQASGDGS